jgi:hypothetical protein
VTRHQVNSSGHAVNPFNDSGLTHCTTHARFASIKPLKTVAPFGGEALSGTGFKAGGQYYLLKFCTERVVTQNLTVIGANTELLFLD